MKKTCIVLATTVLLPAASAMASGGPYINEFVANHTSTDTNEFFEIFAAPNQDLSNYWFIEIEGDSGNTGTIDDVAINLGVADANGFWWSGFMNNALENGTSTYLLVTNFVPGAALGTTDDIDTDDDGVIDTVFWDTIVDSVGVFDGGGGDLNYSSTVLDNTLLGNPGFTVGGASRLPDGTGGWVRNDFDGLGLPGFLGSIDPGEALNTPGTFNSLIPAPGALALLGVAGLAGRRRRRG